MTDATAHDIMAVELTEDEPPTNVDRGTLRSGLESDDNLVRAHAAKVAAGLTAENIEAVKAVVPALIEGLEDERNVVVVPCSAALAVVADDDPALVEPAVPRLVEMLHDDLSVVRSHAARVLGLVALDHPEYLTDHTEGLVEAMAREPVETMDRELNFEENHEYNNHEALERVNMEEERRQIAARGVAANLLVEVAGVDPTLVKPYVPRFVDLLDEIDLRVVTACIDVIGEIGTDDLDAVREAVEPLCDLLAHEQESIAASAAMSLGFIEDERAIAPLRSLANGDGERDRSEDLRELAAETADFIDD